MSFYPLIRDLMDESIYRVLYEQNFGVNINDDSVQPVSTISVPPMRCGYVRHWRTSDSGLSKILSDKSDFKINLDVHHFKPDQLEVRIVDDYIIVDGKHEKKADEHGFISRQFTRHYKIPQDVDQKTIETNITSDGVLNITGKKKEESGGRKLKIHQIKEPAISSTKDKKTEKKEEKMEQ